MIRSFEALKTEMRKDVCLSYPSYSPGSPPLQLYTDASAMAVGACLCQSQDGELHKIAYASMAFTSAQINYSTLENELAAIRWAVKTFRAFLFGVSFIIHTDHQPLVYLQNKRIINSRLARTVEDLAKFSFLIRYTPGSGNTAADALSRAHAHLEDELIDATGVHLPVGLGRLQTVDGGGNSLVQSLQLAANHLSFGRSLPAKSFALRGLLVGEMLRNTKYYFSSVYKTLSSELKLMVHDGQLMCEKTLVSFAGLFSCIVLVHHG